MSGTVREVAGELWADFGLRVRPVPTNRAIRREHRGHLMLRCQADKWIAVAQAVRYVQQTENNRPVLVGTRSVADSDSVSAELTRAGIAHRVLNALQDDEEAEIIAAAGEPGAVTVATNMAGRGTDIELATAARESGGLHVILTAFHETQRIDRQLFGRAGRQGDPGSVEAITALDDELYLLFVAYGVKLMTAWIKEWPVRDGPAEWLRRRAQAQAERRHAAVRRQVELGEEQTRRTLAFTGGE
ncbi:MAG: hypothetical protein C0489_11035 [Candidatus Accumulibacter sp.]|nr:hypothetical protein [Accumulibacter sp.]